MPTSQPAAATYRLFLFGGVSLEGPSGPPSGRVVQRRQLALLSILAASSDRAVTRETLVGLMWPEHPEERARRLLSDSLYLLRQGLGGEAVMTGSGAVQLDPGTLWSDISEFDAAVRDERWAEAVRFYRGSFLDGFYLDGCAEFERWVERQRASRKDRYHEALESLAATEESRGAWLEAVGWWRRRSASDPLNGRVALRLMEALSAAGDTPGALAHARLHESRLRDELGLAPSAEIRARVEELAQEEARRPSKTRQLDGPEGTPLPDGHGSAPTAAPRVPYAERGIRVLRGRRGAGAAVIGSAVVAAVGGWLGLWPQTPSVSATGTASGGTGRLVVAVRPFENLGPAEDAYFADGLTEEITSRLAGAEGLRVVPSRTAAQYVDRNASLGEVGRTLGVDYVLEGSVRWERIDAEPGRVRITPHLLRVADETLVWSHRYDRELAEILRIQAEIAEHVTLSMGITLGESGSSSMEAAVTDDMEAYDLWLKGRNAMWTGLGEEENRWALTFLEHAIARDSSFAYAWAQASFVHSLLYFFGYDRTPARGERALSTAREALALAPELARAHGAMGQYHYRIRQDYDRALEEFELEARYAPSDGSVRMRIAAVLRRQGHFEDAIQTLHEGVEMNPLHPYMVWSLGGTYAALRRFDEAERWFDRAIVLNPTLPNPYESKAWSELGRTGDPAAHRAVLESAPSDTDLSAEWLRQHLLDRNLDAGLAIVAGWGDRIRWTQTAVEPPALSRARLYRAAGRMGDARAESGRAVPILERLVAERPDDHRVHAALGEAYAGLGRKEEAIEAAERAVELYPVSRDALQGPSFLIDLATVYALVGEHERALGRIEELLAMPSRLWAGHLQTDPRWDPLREHPRFRWRAAAPPPDLP